MLIKCISISVYQMLILLDSLFLFELKNALFYLVPDFMVLRIISSQHFRAFVEVELSGNLKICVLN